ncbi:MAG: hypothetical protein KAI70_00750 [Candidatus Omnitrophica bacterium]|nr:hypothetical protein [Candidatus Omnitrophota bacterium]
MSKRKIGFWKIIRKIGIIKDILIQIIELLEIIKALDDSESAKMAKTMMWSKTTYLNTLIEELKA